MANNGNVNPTATAYPELVKPTQYYTGSNGGSSAGDGSIIITLGVFSTAVGMVALVTLVLFGVLFSYRRWKQFRAGAVSTALDLSDTSGLCVVFGGKLFQ